MLALGLQAGTLPEGQCALQGWGLPETHSDAPALLDIPHPKEPEVLGENKSF